MLLLNKNMNVIFKSAILVDLNWQMAFPPTVEVGFTQ